MRTSSILLSILLLGTGLRASEPTPAMQLDTSATTAPINPYIYGQFIEHLGRCIYGGTWAEMLEDRKFYFPITEKFEPYRELAPTAGTSDFNVGNLQQSDYPALVASPWEIVGAPAGVTMQTEDAFVGEHTPRIQAGHGIRHHKLGVVAGKSYTGYLWAKPTEAKRATIEVTLITGPAPTDRITTTFNVQPSGYTKHPFILKAVQTTDQATLEITVKGSGLLLGTVSLMPADNVRGMRRDTLALLKQLNGPIYRWPGGNFVSGYDWRDGIGDRDRRPPRGNPAWTGIEHNDFGTDEFIDFCREIGTEPMIAANTGFGDAYSAAQWVEYVNGPSTSLAGGWRTRNGHQTPYSVKHWCVGNEMFGPWQLGFMQLHQYALKHNLVAKAMHAVDPSLVLVGVGSIGKINKDNDPEQAKRGLGWSEGMLLACADRMDLISEHVYAGRLPWEADTGRATLETHVGLLRTAIRNVAEQHRAFQTGRPELKGRIVPIAMDEWNYWHREYTFGELGCAYDLADALGIAAALHEYFRQSDIIQMAHYAQTVNVIGAIKTSKTAAEMETTGLVLQMYRAHFGQTPIKIAQDFAPLDVAAALTADGKALTVAIVNPTEKNVALPLALTGIQPAGPASRWLIGGPDERAVNIPGQPRRVDIVQADGLDAALPLEAPARSCALYRIPLR